MFVLDQTAKQLSIWQRDASREPISPASTSPRGNCCGTT
jgi:hypothetical protein